VELGDEASDLFENGQSLVVLHTLLKKAVELLDHAIPLAGSEKRFHDCPWRSIACKGGEVPEILRLFSDFESYLRHYSDPRGDRGGGGDSSFLYIAIPKIKRGTFFQGVAYKNFNGKGS
jgi:hypothetical protein